MTVSLTIRDECPADGINLQKNSGAREKEQMTIVLRKGESFLGRAARKRAAP